MNSLPALFIAVGFVTGLTMVIFMLLFATLEKK
jgi:hypothetical protein